MIRCLMFAPAILLASIGVRPAEAQQRVVAVGCISVPTVGTCPTDEVVTPEVVTLTKYYEGKGNYDNSWTFRDGSTASVRGNAAILSPISQQATASSTLLNPGSKGSGTFYMGAWQTDTLTVTSSNPADSAGTIWFKVAINVSSMATNTGSNAGGARSSIYIDAMGPGITYPAGWQREFCISGINDECGSLTAETTHFGFRFGSPFQLSYNTSAEAWLGYGSSTASNSVMTSIVGIYVTDANGNQIKDGISVSSALGGVYSLIPTAPQPKPTLTSITPAVGTVGSTVGITLNGTNFVRRETSVSVSGNNNEVDVWAVDVINSTMLTANLTIHDKAAIGSRKVTVKTVAGQSNEVTFGVQSKPVPTLTSINPGAGTAGSTFQLALNGTNFVPGQTSVSVSGDNGVAVGPIDVLSSTMLTTTLTIGPNAAVGPRNVTVTTTAGTSNSVAFSVQSNLVPTLTSMNPGAGTVGSTFQVALNGTNFVPGQTSVSVSGDNGVTVGPINVLSSTMLTTSLTIGLNAAVGSRNVSVTTPAGTSNSLTCGIQGLPSVGSFAQVASGGGWKTTITLINRCAVTANARIDFYANDGSPMILPLVFPLTGSIITSSSSELTIAPNASIVIESEASTSSIAVGSASVEGSCRLSGYAIFRLRSANAENSEGTVPLDTQTSSLLAVPYNNTDGFRSALALANQASTATTVTATVTDENGRRVGSFQIVLPALGHTSFFLSDQFSQTANRVGIVELQSSGSLTAVGLRFSPTISFTSVPIIR
jgi:hypothetical protein